MILTIMLAAALAAAQPVDCSAWNLGGFRVGMTKEQVEKLRLGKWQNPISFVVEEGKTSIAAGIDAKGVMFSAYSIREPAEWDAIVAEMTAQYGEPKVTRPSASDPKLDAVRLATWSGTACGVLMRLAEFDKKPRPFLALSLDRANE